MKSGFFVGKAISMVVNLLNIDLVLIGGSVAFGFGEPFLSEVRSTAESFCGLSFTKDLKIDFASLREDAPLVGAAAVWQDSKEKSPS